MLAFLTRGIFEYLLPAKTANSENIEIKETELKIWMIGHATTLINFYGTTILTDPIFTRGLPFPARLVQPGVKIDQLPKIDFVLISHGHLDHFNKPSLKKLIAKTNTIIIPRNCKDLLRGMHYKNIAQLDWNQTQEISSVKITAFQPVHWGDRYHWQAHLNRGYNSYILQKNAKTIFFCGDSGYGNFFTKLGSIYNVDIALLPINSYNPPAFRQIHLNPQDAIQAFSELKAKHLLPIHWGNFRLSFESMKEPPQLIAKLAKEKGIEDKVHILQNGESFTLEST